MTTAAGLIGKISAGLESVKTSMSIIDTIKRLFQRPKLYIAPTPPPVVSTNQPQAEDRPPVGWSGVGPGKIQINDIVFDLPPEKISITQHYRNLEIPLLRTKENSTLKSGRGEFLLHVPLLFVDHNNRPAWQIINEKLLPLIQQFRKTPFCLVENELVRKALFPGTYDDNRGRRHALAKNMAFSMVNMTINTVEGLPGALEANLELSYFNYFPFSEKFTFLRHWNSRTPVSLPASNEEAAEAIKQYHQQSLEVYNPQESAAWQAFWQHGFDYHQRRLTGDLTNSFALEFTFLNTRTQPASVYQMTWRATSMIPVHLSVSFSNYIAKLPVLNWVYPTHQYVGGANRVLTAVFYTSQDNRAELEHLQYLVQREQEQTANFRYLSQYWGVKIYNDLARLCGIKAVVVEDLHIDTVPGSPTLIQVTLVMREHHLREEALQPLTHIPRLDSVLQQTLERLIRLGKDLQLITTKNVTQYELVGLLDEHGRLINPGFEGWVPNGEIVIWRRQGFGEAYSPQHPSLSSRLYHVFLNYGGPYNDNLLDLLNRRPNMLMPLPTLPGQNVVRDLKEREYYDRLRSLLQAILDGPLREDERFTDLRQAAFQITGNYKGNICYPDLDLPPHPVTNRIIDTEPDCYFYNRSDTRPADLSRAFAQGLEVIRNAYASANNVLKGSGGLGWDYQVPATSRPSSLPISDKPRRPSQIGRAAYEDIIQEASRRYPRISPDLLRAMIQVESGFNPDAVSPKGASGLMQIMPATAEDLAKQLSRDFSRPVTADMVLHEPYWNIMGGALYMNQMLQQFGSIELALAAYNAGPGRVSQAGNRIPDIPETKQYVSKVMALASSPAPSNVNTFIMPVGGRITSDFYDSRDSGNRLHYGLDIAAPIGTPVVAPTNLNITAVGYSDTYGHYIYATDQYGNTHMFGHLHERPPVQVGQQVRQGEVIGQVGNSGTSTGPHLDWKVKGPDGQYLDMGKYFQVAKGDRVNGGQSAAVAFVIGDAHRSQLVSDFEERSFAFWDHPPDNPGSNANLKSMPLLQHLGWAGKDVDYISENLQQLKSQTLSPRNPHTQDLGPAGAQEIFRSFTNTFQENIFTMRRAYPAFALTFTDEFRRGLTFLNNSFGWGAVREIKLIRSRKNPVDTLIVQLSNTRGDLLTQQFNAMDGSLPEDLAINQQVLKEGTDVRLQLGYSNNPANLPLVFTGKITEIEGQNSAIITIVCQSYALELLQAEYGDSPVATMGWFNSDTKEIISSLLVLPECQHLGRYQRRQVVQPGESSSGRAGTGWFPWRYFFSGLIPNPADNNVFVPDDHQMDMIWESIKKGFRENWLLPFSWMKYVPYRQLPWEIIEEMTLRHPGYIASVVPYDGVGHHKATLFFGVPSQMYFWRGVNDFEAYQLSQEEGFTFGDVHGSAFADTPLRRRHQEILRQRMRPFRQYFYIDSEHHLILNGLITTARDTYNAVEVEYVSWAEKAFGDVSQDKRPDPSNFFTLDSVKVKANDRIPEDYCRWFHTRERNCEGPVWGRKYAVSYLFRHLKDLYTGEIIILGEPAIKPYDVVFLYDSYNDVCGPIEVEQVTHIFSPETGFITTIIPDLCVQTNEYASASLIEALQLYFGALWLRTNSPKAKFGSGEITALDLADLPWTGLPSGDTVKIHHSLPESVLATAGAAAPIVALFSGGLAGLPISILLGFAGITLFNWARRLNPIRVTPVIWKGRPFLCGLDGFLLDTAWGHAGNGVRRAFNGLGDLMQQLIHTVRHLMGGNF